MIDGIFTRLKPENSTAIRKPFENIHTDAVHSIVDIEDLTTALASVVGEIDMAHSSFQKLYEEATYIYSRLEDMEKSYSNQQKEVSSSKQSKEADDSEGSSGTSSVVEKVLFSDAHSSSLSGKLLKIQEAKELTQNLLKTIEILSEKVQKSNKVILVKPEGSVTSTPSTPRFEIK